MEMERVATFEPVSDEMRKFLLEKLAEEEGKEIIVEGVKLPVRATPGSGGHDFFAPYDITIPPHGRVMIYSFVRCRFINPGYTLKLYPKSGIAIKHQIELVNTVGIIDSDYYKTVAPGQTTNEGHIIIALKSHAHYAVSFPQGSKIVQGLLEPYAITLEDDVSTMETRKGGLGSTGL